jgi:galactokinase
MSKDIALYFRERFAQEPILIIAPGRINLIGEHTDYNNGFVMPAAIDKCVTFAVAKSNTNTSTVLAIDLNEEISFSINELTVSNDWSTYLKGVVYGFTQMGLDIGNVNVVFQSTIPIGAGLSSSAALCCGFAFAINELFDFKLDKLALAKIAQQTEHTFAGVKCGIMDQYASLFGKKGLAMLLDCRSLQHQYFPLALHDHSLLLVDTKVKHSLASSAYNKRRESCEEGISAIQQKYKAVQSLRDVTASMLAEFSAQLSTETISRCSYIVSEIDRTQKAAQLLKQNKIVDFGKLLYETHEGLSTDYEVSCDELDYLVNLAKEHNITGARMMGGGFGGCTLNLIQSSKIKEFKIAVAEKYFNQFEVTPEFYDVSVKDGVHEFKI